MIKVWFEPHSTSIDNEDGRASGWNDVDLSAKGRLESLDLIERCRSRGLFAIFCSDLQRAVKTAVPTAAELHLPLFPDKRLRECDYGNLTRKPKEQIETERDKRINEPFPNGESYEQCMERMGSFINQLRVDFDNKAVLIVGHRATHYALDYFIKKKPLETCISEQWQWQPGWQYEL